MAAWWQLEGSHAGGYIDMWERNYGNMVVIVGKIFIALFIASYNKNLHLSSKK